MKLEELVGEVLTHIDVDPEKDEILLTTKSGRQIKISGDDGDDGNDVAVAMIEDAECDWHALIGKPILESTHEETKQSGTRTVLTFKVDDATVISRWFGDSNGYYSESVGIKEITRPVQLG